MLSGVPHPLEPKKAISMANLAVTVRTFSFWLQYHKHIQGVKGVGEGLAQKCKHTMKQFAALVTGRALGHPGNSFSTV
jgi:hypothetical protein